jgi:hypothetical protein
MTLPSLIAGDGKCRFCGCTEDRACVFEYIGLPVACWWVTKERDVCSAPACFGQYLKEQRAGRQRRRPA